MSNYKWIPAVMYLIVILSAFIQVVAELLNKQGQEAADHSYIIIRADRKNRKLKLSDIAYVESMSDYINIHLFSDEVIVTREKISNISERLTASFLRIHRSFIINLEHLESYTREEVIVLGKELPISRTYKKEAIDKLHSIHD